MCYLLTGDSACSNSHLRVLSNPSTQESWGVTHLPISQLRIGQVSKDQHFLNPTTSCALWWFLLTDWSEIYPDLYPKSLGQPRHRSARPAQVFPGCINLSKSDCKVSHSMPGEVICEFLFYFLNLVLWPWVGHSAFWYLQKLNCEMGIHSCSWGVFMWMKCQPYSRQWQTHSITDTTWHPILRVLSRGTEGTTRWQVKSQCSLPYCLLCLNFKRQVSGKQLILQVHSYTNTLTMGEPWSHIDRMQLSPGVGSLLPNSIQGHGILPT